MAEFVESGGAKSNRRDFVRASVGLGAAGVAAFGAIDKLLAEGVAAPSKPMIKPGDVVLFQGDSITDMGRKRGIDEANNEGALGTGYRLVRGFANVGRFASGWAQDFQSRRQRQ